MTRIGCTTDVPRRIVDVFTAAAANVVITSGKKGGCTIHTCRTRAASAETMVLTAAAALEPSTTSRVHLQMCWSSSQSGGSLFIMWFFSLSITSC